MRIRKLLGACSAVAVSVSAVSVVSYAALFEGDSDNKTYQVMTDAYIDYTKVSAIDAVITVNGEYVDGAIGLCDLNGDWHNFQGSGSNETTTWHAEGLDGIFAVDGKDAFQVQFWNVSDGATFTVDSVTLYDADGNVITPGDTAVTRPDVRFPDAEPLDIDNSALNFMSGSSQIDIAEAVGDDFDNIGKITATFKWGTNGYWNGCADLSGCTLADGSGVVWTRSPELGNVNDNHYLMDEEKMENTYVLFDYSENPITGLSLIGNTGELAGYAALTFGFWGQDEDPNPAISNVSFYDKDNQLIASLDYDTPYDTADTADAEIAEDSADAVTEDTSAVTAPDKGNPDTGAAGAAAFIGAAAAAGVGAFMSRKRK